MEDGSSRSATTWFGFPGSRGGSEEGLPRGPHRELPRFNAVSAGDFKRPATPTAIGLLGVILVGFCCFWIAVGLLMRWLWFVVGSVARFNVVDPLVPDDDSSADATSRRALLDVLPRVSTGTQTEGNWDRTQPDLEQHVINLCHRNRMDLVQVIESVLVVLGDCERGCCPRDGTTAVPNTAQSNRRVLCDNWTQCDGGDGNRLCTDIDHEKIQGDLQRERLQCVVG